MSTRSLVMAVGDDFLWGVFWDVVMALRRATGSGDFAQEGEFAAAVVAAVWWFFGKLDGGLGAAAQEGSDAVAGFDGGTGEVAVVAHSCEAFW